MLTLITYAQISTKFLLSYFTNLRTSFHDTLSIIGFVIMTVIGVQILSGIMLSFSLMAEPMLVPLVRDEEDLIDLYIDDFLWMHERGVDMIIISLFLHLLRKLYLLINNLEQEYSWKSGAIIFVIIQGTIFAGLTLSCTHLSEITLTIAANTAQSLTLFKGDLFYFIFTDKLLNTDTLVRLAYLHYILPFWLMYLGVIHGVDMHYDWKSEYTVNGISLEMMWWDEALSNEVGKTVEIISICGIICLFLYSNPEALSYEIFMWGDIGMNNDIRFYGVAPHWYFRPYMAWLIACPYHYAGIFGLGFFFFSIYFQVAIFSVAELHSYKISKNWLLQLFNLNYNNTQWNSNCVENSLWWRLSFSILLVAILYTMSYLPYGRFYNRLGGNFALLCAYFYIFFYLGFVYMRHSWILSSSKLNLLN